MPQNHPPPPDRRIIFSGKKCSESRSRLPATTTNAIPNASLARYNVAPSACTPQGSPEYSQKYAEYSVLQQHVLFWDRDNDGIIRPWDTYVGFRELGFSIVFSLIAVILMNGSFSYPSRLAHSYLPDPMFRIYVSSIHKVKHGSDTGIYDSEGRFRPQMFEDLFAKYDRDSTGGLSPAELFDLIHGDRVAADPYGWCAAFMEWFTTWLLIQKDGRVWKEDIRQCYDGSLFWRIREERISGRGWDQGYGFSNAMKDLFGYRIGNSTKNGRRMA
ncbi:MAG: hypothetical protein Q9187_006493 [Circinaria calcarea]